MLPSCRLFFSMPNHTHDLFFIADFHVINPTTFHRNVSGFIIITIFVNECELSQFVELFVDFNFDDFLFLLKIKKNVEVFFLILVKVKVLKFERLAVVKHPVEISDFLVPFTPGAQKLRQGATSVSVCVDGLSAWKSNFC